MKGDFIPKFVKAAVQLGIDMYDIWNWQPLYYKGIKVKGYNYSKAYSGFKNLEHRGILRKTKMDNYIFTDKGRGWFRGALLKYHHNKSTRWDKKWRIVIFDIPQELHKNRNYFRNKLKYLGFYMLQKSVFVIPYPCEEELGLICNNLKVIDYVDIIEANTVGFKEKNIRKYFGI